MDERFEPLAQHGVAVGEGLGYTGGSDKYAAALQRYYRNYGSNRKAVEDTLAAGDVENYTIKVHALKSNSKMIGADDLSAAFEALELAGSRGDAAFLAGHTPAALAAYAALVELLRPIGEAVPDSAARKLHIVSAYMSKNNSSGSITQALNVGNPPQLTPEAPLGPVASALIDSTIAQESNTVKPSETVQEALPLAAPDLDAARETEPRYLPTAEEILAEDTAAPASGGEEQTNETPAGH